MSHQRMGLAAILASGRPDFAFKLAEGHAHRSRPLDDVLGVLVRDRQLQFVWQGNARENRLSIELVYDGPRTAQHEVLRFCDLHPHGIWVARLGAGDERGTLVPFMPPRVTVLSSAVPLYVPPDKREQAARVGIRGGQDALAPLALRFGEKAVLIVGQQGLAALSEEAAQRLTLWSPDGDAIEVQIEREGEGVRLVFLEVASALRACDAHCVPNLIVRLEGGAALPVVRDEARADADSADAFMPKRSPLLQTWMLYAQLERELSEKRLQARLQSALTYSDARQHKKLWHATIALDEVQQKAWLGADPESHQEVKIDQQVEFEQEGPPASGQEGRLVLTKMRVDGGGVVRATLRPGRGFRRMPERGRLRAIENIGSKVERIRRLEAMEILQAGRAACPSLMNLLSDPRSAEPPQTVSIRPTRLDDSQRRALEKILGCIDLVAIQGPPGTGKTSVIVEALQQLAAARRKGEALRVLVSSVQNEAIDNVAERLAREGILVHQVRRQSQDEDEALQQALHQDQTRSDVLKALERSLEGKPVLAVLDRLRQSLVEIDRIRAVMADERALLALAQEIGSFCRETDLPTALREEGGKLCTLLKEQASRPEPPAAAAPTPQTELPPQSPEATQDWWEARKALWPLATRAPVEAAARKVIENTERTRQNPERYTRQRDRAFAEMLSILSKIEKPPLAPAASEPDAPTQPAESWLERVEQELHLRERKLHQHPEVIARHFLDRLREHPAAWRQIQRRHSQTTTATCSMSAQTRDLTDDPYDLAIIDEAGRATPLELLVPMVQAKRIVLIGDHRQLPPLVEDEVISACEREQAPAVDLDTETLFKEIFENLRTECKERLSVQYRMHEMIGQLVNLLFYKPHDEKLRSYFAGSRAAERLPAYGILDDAPVTLIDTEDRQHSSPYENREERLAVLALLTAFAGSPKVRTLSEPLRIGVICAYARQREKLLEELEQQQLLQPALWALAPLQVEIKTIDAVQGREYPVAIVCLVRRDGRPGFLAAPNRINVALSRAQRQLIILTTPASLTTPVMREHAAHMQKLVDYCKEIRRIKPWSEVRL